METRPNYAIFLSLKFNLARAYKYGVEGLLSQCWQEKLLTLEEENSSFDVKPEFIEQNQKLNNKYKPKRGGPYTQNERDKRMNEVYRLHFEYGYSARKISELMKINRNTVNGDINYWYSKIFKSANFFDPSSIVVLNIERLEIQRTRLREQLDKTKSFQEKMQLERLIYEIDCKILFTYNKMTDSTRRVHDLTVERINEWLKDNRRKERYLTLFDKISVSNKKFEKINKIIKGE